jgi:putative membrane protein
MNGFLLVIGAVFALIAALIHLLSFFLESVLWARPAVWRRFGLRSQADADVVRPMAYNQGFYNLFLALGVGGGLGLMGWSYASLGGVWQGGIYVVLFALACMVLASLVLLSTNRRFWQSTILQGAAALLGIVFLILPFVLPAA